MILGVPTKYSVAVIRAIANYALRATLKSATKCSLKSAWVKWVEWVELVTASSPSCARFGLSINVLSRTMEMIIIAKCKHSTTVVLVVLHVGCTGEGRARDSRRIIFFLFIYIY